MWNQRNLDGPDEPVVVNLFDKNDADVVITGRINSSGNAVNYAEGQLVTGWIEGKVGDKFTIKCDKPNTANLYVGSTNCFRADKSYITNLSTQHTANGTVSMSDDGMTVTCVIPSTYNATDFSQTAYVRFCVAYTDIDSIVITKKSGSSTETRLLNLDREYVTGTVNESIYNGHLDESKAYLNVSYDSSASPFTSASSTATNITEDSVTVTESGAGGICVCYPVYLPGINTHEYRITFDYSGAGKCRSYYKYAKEGTNSGINVLHIDDTAGTSGSVDVTIPVKADYDWLLIFLSSNTGNTKTFTNVSVTKA